MYKTTENYISDNPVENKEQDRFQRFPFAKRIAETIMNRKSKDSIVFGLFGTWGEGKSSVINFIKSVVTANEEDFIQVTFNPWRFTDESTLLVSFFNTLAKSIKDKSNKPESKNFLQKSGKLVRNLKNKYKDPLQTDLEKAGDLMFKYGKVASLVGMGDVAETVGKILAKNDIEDLKSRIEKLLLKSKKRIIIYIDDIDRLEKNEIHSIFRLVKLTGDFSYTAYILSFDESMVASAIAERYGAGDKKSGENFLEKIIQVPLQIPKAQQSALEEYCLEITQNALLENKVNLLEKETQRFIDQFSRNILPKLTTPRLAVRYGNSITFTIPLLKDEVNMVDLLLIQAVHIFYPQYYQFVKTNPEYFIETYSSIIGAGKDQNKIDKIKEHFEKLGENLSDAHKSKAQDLLQHLFPVLNNVFTTYYSSSTEYYNNWYKEKNIVSEHYFDRYFTYTVIKGDISDVTFKDFIEKLKTGKPETLDIVLKDILQTSNAKNFTIKLRSFEKEIDWYSSKELSLLISDNINFFSSENGFMGVNYGTPFSDAALFISQLVKNHSDKIEQFEFAKKLMSYPRFDFAFSINNWFRAGRDEEEKIFTEEQFLELAQILVERSIKESGDRSIFEEFHYYIGYLTSYWRKINPKEYENYVITFLDKDPENVLRILETFVPTMSISGKEEPYKSDIEERTFDYITQNVDKDLIMERVKQLELYKKIEDEDVYWNPLGDKEYSRINMLRQFKHWYDSKTAGNNE